MVEIITAMYLYCLCKTTCDVAHVWPACFYFLGLLVCLNGMQLATQ